MAAVIAFPTQQTIARESEKNFGPAQVIIFSGVRHERLSEGKAALPRHTLALQIRQNHATAEKLK